MHVQLAESLTDDDPAAAIEHYQKAVEYCTSDSQTSGVIKSQLKVAELASDREDYALACELFEEVGNKRLENDLTKFNARGHFLDAGICMLARGDTVAARMAIDRFRDADYSFADSRECKLLTDLTDAVEASNVDSFTEHLFAFDQISKLSPWRTKILLRVKNGMGDLNGDGEDEIADLA